MGVRTDYLLADVDGHYYEPDDAFSRHSEPAYRDAVIRVVREHPEDRGRVLLGDDVLEVFPTHLSDATLQPGAVRGSMYGDERVKPTAETEIVRAQDIPASVDRVARLAAMDHWGIETNVVFPTLALTVWPELVRRGSDVLYANLRSFNRWVEETWSYGGDGRIFGAPYVVLVDAAAAVAELERLLRASARTLAIVPASPRMGALPGEERFDGFWARVSEANVPITMHGCVVSYGDLYSPADHFTSLARMTALQYLFEVERQVMDTVASLVLDDVFGRHPGLRLATVELGSRWVEPLLGAMDRAANQTNTPWQRVPREARPSDVFREHVWVQPFETDDLVRLASLIGTDRMLFGSDYPHPEGLENPLLFLDALAKFRPEDRRRILRDNFFDLLGTPPPPAPTSSHP